jgi:septal ring factor EnvC (AmiA/AmiB activator)
MQSQFMNDSLAATCASKQAELQKQANQLQDRLADIEQSLIEERQTNDRMAQSLASVNTHVEQLSQEVTFWRGEVRRIEDDAKRNHESDIAALDALASLVEQVPSPDSAADAIRQLPPAQE